jgi:collagenase-like PrtC family protease
MNSPTDKIALELLAPAGSADIGIAAIDHGADAIYIGAPLFSARANAGVEMSEIARLIRHAHFYRAKVYVALNTILTDGEIPKAFDLVREIYNSGADGLIVQDLGLLELDLPPIPLIASTQMHNHTPERVRFLEQVGFKRVILARELSLKEITAIRRVTAVELECFVHGALCVSYSGQCYMSQAVAGRSGNRGVCAQPCRSRYTLVDANGSTILADRFFLSLKDLNLLNDLPDLVAAGVTSFKIEGRYKEIDYVKNVTAAYSRMLDEFGRQHPQYCRSSSGRSDLAFSPDLWKTFNRGYTRYFIGGRKGKVASMNTPKSTGEPVGTVTRIGKDYFQTDCSDLRHGDGLCFFTRKMELAGFRVERIENSKIFPSTMKSLTEGARLYRNHDIALTRLLNRRSGQRRIEVEMRFTQSPDKVRLAVIDEDGNSTDEICRVPFEKSRDAARMKERVGQHLSSTGTTPFKVRKVAVSGSAGFLPISSLNQIKHRVLENLALVRLQRYRREEWALKPNNVPFPEKRVDFRANIFNEYSRRFYERHGAEVVESAFECLSETTGKEVMRTRYCLLHELDACTRSGKSRRRLAQPLQIYDEHHNYLLKFDCDACMMSLIFLGKR